MDSIKSQCKTKEKQIENLMEMLKFEALRHEITKKDIRISKFESRIKVLQSEESMARMSQVEVSKAVYEANMALHTQTISSTKALEDKLSQIKNLSDNIFLEYVSRHGNDAQKYLETLLGADGGLEKLIKEQSHELISPMYATMKIQSVYRMRKAIQLANRIRKEKRFKLESDSSNLIQRRWRVIKAKRQLQYLKDLKRNNAALMHCCDKLIVQIDAVQRLYERNGAHFNSSITVSLYCRECFEPLEDSTTLFPCGHTLCTSCVKQSEIRYNQIRCNECINPLLAEPRTHTLNPTLNLLNNFSHSSEERRKKFLKSLHSLKHAVADLLPVSQQRVYRQHLDYMELRRAEQELLQQQQMVNSTKWKQTLGSDDRR
jgi:hypothetical protein